MSGIVFIFTLDYGASAVESQFIHLDIVKTGTKLGFQAENLSSVQSQSNICIQASTAKFLTTVL